MGPDGNDAKDAPASLFNERDSIVRISPPRFRPLQSFECRRSHAVPANLWQRECVGVDETRDRGISSK